MLYNIFKPLLFALKPEEAHEVALKGLDFYTKLTSNKMLYKPVNVMGINFPNRVGLAAGFDKNGAHSTALFKLGFGFVEVGTMTPKAQVGNPKPRLFRLQQDLAIINRMGFNNDGVENYLAHHAQDERLGILGINIGKNKDTPVEKAVEDYLFAYRHVYPFADYVTINVSSPNTPDLRKLETGESLNHLLEALTLAREMLKEKYHKKVPLVVKISPDLSDDELKVTTDCLLAHGIDGIIATNTTLSRDSLRNGKQIELGGLSGEPLKEKSREKIRLISEYTQGKLPIIGVGGIMSVEDAVEVMQAGASLVQLYTGFIYQGPNLVNRVVKAL